MSKIPWCDDTINPIFGCLNACPWCYAKRIAPRVARLMAARHPEKFCQACADFVPHFHPERLEQFGKGKPRIIFADSMSDWWSPGVSPWWRRTILDQLVVAPWHRFVVLTKRPDNILESDTTRWPSNAWLGVSVTSGADWWRWEALAKLPDHIHKFISVEPLLGRGVGNCLYTAMGWMEWCIVGPMSGPGAIPPPDNSQGSIRTACRERSVPLFEKPGLALQPPVRQMPADLAGVFQKGGLT